MILKTKQELTEQGFILVAKNTTNEMEVWARFTGYADYIQYLDFKEDVYTGNVETISYGKLCLFEEMKKVLLCKQLFKLDNVAGRVTDRWEGNKDIY